MKIAVLFSAHELNPLVNAIDRVLYLGAGEAVLGAVDEVITGPVLSRLYGAQIEVVRVKDRVFVMAGDVDVERDAHRHDASPRPRPCAWHDAPCLTTISCAPPSPPPASSRCSPGSVGFFLVLRGQTFAGHALSHVGFTGATGAVLFGLPPLAGLVGFTVLAGLGMGLLGEKLSERDVAIGMMLSLALGLGLLFLHFYTASATQATALLFGNVLGVDTRRLLALAVLAVVEPRGARRHRPAADFRLACRANSRRRGACRCASSRSPFWRSSRSRSPNARRSSACCWSSR